MAGGLAALAAALMLPRLFLGSLRHWDEAWYAQVSREMLQTGDWLTLHWNYAPWFHKPPLFFWATAGVFSLIGETEVTARLFSFICTVACVTAVAAFMAKQAGRPAGLTASLFLLAIPDFVDYGARGQLDGPLTLWITLSLFAFWIGLESPRWQWAMGLFFGLAILTKGAAAGLILVIQCSYMVFAKDVRPMRQRQWWGGFAVAALLSAPWHVQQCVQHGHEFTSAYFARHFQQFFTHIYPEVHYKPAGPLFYLEYLVQSHQPFGWLLLALVTIGGWFAFRSRDRRLLFYWCWASVPLFALSMARTKWGWYLVPLYPGAALFAASLCVHCAKFSIRTAAGWAGVFACITAGSVLWTPANREYENHIHDLASVVQRYVPARVPIHTLQVGRASQSVYPISTLYYCQRPVRAAHGLDHFLDVCRRSDAMFYALVHESQLAALNQRARPSGEERWFRIEHAGQSGPVLLLRIVPGYLAEAIYGKRE